MNAKRIPIFTLLIAALIGVMVAMIGYWIIGFSLALLINVWSYSKSEYLFSEYSKLKRAIVGAALGVLVFGLAWSTTSNIVNSQVSTSAY
ncbi:hypothetical protein [Ekhidna sp.]